MSIVAIHDRIMDAAKIESAQILLPSGSCGKQNLRTRLLVGSGYLPGREGCPPGRSGRPSRRRRDLSEPGFLSEPGSLSSRGSLLRPGFVARRRGCPSGGLV